MDCPCQSERSYKECCERYHKGQATAPTAEILMRSRYSAFVINDVKYLYKSWSKRTRPSKKLLVSKQNNHWLGLKIVRVERGTIFDSEGLVEFIGKFRDERKEHKIHESSRFIRENGKWVYLDGEFLNAPLHNA